MHSHASAARLWGQALALCPPDDALRPRLLLEYGKTLAIADEPAVEILDEAAGALIEAGDVSGAAEAESTIGWLLSLAGQQDQARARDERALELVRDAAPSYTKALILARAGTHAVPARETRAEVICLLGEALSISEQLGLREIQAEALQYVGMTHLDAGDERGVEDNEKALDRGHGAQLARLPELLWEPRGYAQVLRLARRLGTATSGRRARGRALWNPRSVAEVSRRASRRPVLQRRLGRGADA